MALANNLDDISFNEEDKDEITDEDVTEAEVIEDNQERPTPESPTYEELGFVKCQICGEWKKFLNHNHLKRHDLTLQQYRDQFPDAVVHYQEYNKDPNRKQLAVREDIYVDAKGRVRERATGHIVRTNFLDKSNQKPKLTDIETYLRQNLIGQNGETVFRELFNIALYSQRRNQHKDPWYTTAEKLKAMELLLAYGFGRPKTRKEISSTIKKLEVKIGGKPQDFDPEDF